MEYLKLKEIAFCTQYSIANPSVVLVNDLDAFNTMKY